MDILEKRGVKYYLDDIPLNKNGSFDLKNSVGHHIKFKYNYLEGQINIIDYLKNKKYKKLIIEYKGDTKEIYASDLCRPSVYHRLIFGAELRSPKKIGDHITRFDGKEFVVIGVSTRKLKDDKNNDIRPYYRLKCLKCGSEIVVDTKGLVKPPCYVCANHKSKPGYNDIPTTDPWMIPFFKDDEEASKYCAGSNTKIYPRCPTCGKTHDKKVSIALLKAHNGFRCKYCSDKIPYSEKIIINLLDQLHVRYYHEAGHQILPFDCKDRRYDFYLPDYSCIIETHGIQHYQDANFNGYLVKAKNVQLIDLEKENIAKPYIQNYIVLDCRKSDIDYIKESVFNSKLPALLHFSIDEINWLECIESVCSTLIKKICDRYHNDYIPVSQLAKEFNRCKDVIIDSLKKGEKLGWCTYSALINPYRKPVEAFKNGKHCLYGRSTMELSDKMKRELDLHKFSQSRLSKCLNTKQPYIVNNDKYTIEFVSDIPTKWNILKGLYDDEIFGGDVL